MTALKAPQGVGMSKQASVTCAAVTRAGEPCSMPPLLGRDRCFAHSPSVAVERAAARKRGGAVHAAENAAGEVPSLRTAADVRREAELGLRDVKLLANSARKATALVSVLSLALRILEVGEFEVRLADVERQISGGQNVGTRTPLEIA